MMFLEKFPAFKKITKESFDQQRRRIILDREKRLSFLVEKRIHTQDSKKKSFDRYAEAQIEIKRAQKSIGKPQLEKIWLNYMVNYADNSGVEARKMTPFILKIIGNV